jgi:hypothetical protein
LLNAYSPPVLGRKSMSAMRSPGVPVSPVIGRTSDEFRTAPLLDVSTTKKLLLMSTTNASSARAGAATARQSPSHSPTMPLVIPEASGGKTRDAHESRLNRSETV